MNTMDRKWFLKIVIAFTAIIVLLFTACPTSEDPGIDTRIFASPGGLFQGTWEHKDKSAFIYRRTFTGNTFFELDLPSGSEAGGTFSVDETTKTITVTYTKPSSAAGFKHFISYNFTSLTTVEFFRETDTLRNGTWTKK
jgi:hypothetical protein